jgi:murein L,D-transpeptidase YafK
MHPKASRALRLVSLLAIGLAACGAYALWPSGSAPAEHPDRIVVEKGQRTLSLLCSGQVLRTYTVSLGRNPTGPKTRNSDHKTPEGLYRIDWRNPQSKFHLSLHISYPSPQDTANAHRAGVEPGGEIMIHGLPNHLWWLGRFHRLIDWTDGCIAVTNSEMDQLWRVVPDGTPVEIRP